MKNDKYTKPEDNKFHQGNGDDGKHYWLTPPDLMEQLQVQFEFNFGVEVQEKMLRVKK